MAIKRPGTAWTEEEWEELLGVMSRSSSLGEAARAMGMGAGSSISKLFARRGLDPMDFLAGEGGMPDSVYGAPGTKGRDSSVPESAEFDLFRAIRGKPIPFAELCDRLDVSPKRARELIAKAQAAGVRVALSHDHVGLEQPEPTLAEQDTGIPPVIGEVQRVGVISDTHLGSKYCLRAQLIDFVNWAYHDRGVREILHPGDALDGAYKKNGQLWECSHYGLDAQCQDLFETLPHLPGLTYHAITGNHEETFFHDTGQDVGHSIERYFAHPPNGQTPRNDLKFYGNRGAFINIRGIRVHLWHPRSGKSYARTYHLQRLATMYAGGEKPHLTLAGHWHVSAYCVERGIHMIACPTFQGGGSAFGKSLGGAPEIGGLVLGWELTEHGTIRNFSYERRAYFEVEGPQNLGLGAGVHIGYGE
jgi:hypothetical protein